MAAYLEWKKHSRTLQDIALAGFNGDPTTLAGIGHSERVNRYAVLLAKQLGRWAHIYYTASVDKREAAVEKLVCELEAEAARLAQTGIRGAANTSQAPSAVQPPSQSTACLDLVLLASYNI